MDATCFGTYRPTSGMKIYDVKHKKICILMFWNLWDPIKSHEIFFNKVLRSCSSTEVYAFYIIYISEYQINKNILYNIYIYQYIKYIKIFYIKYIYIPVYLVHKNILYGVYIYTGISNKKIFYIKYIYTSISNTLKYFI